MAYDAAVIDRLADDAEFVARVRAFARTLLASGAVPAERVSDVAGLTRYGPALTGPVIRLASLPHLIDVPVGLLPEWVELSARLEPAEVA